MKKMSLKYTVSFLITILFGGYLFYFGSTFQDNNLTENREENISQESLNLVGQLTKEDLECKDCNLVIISLTNTRKDHMGIYGYERDTTPNIDDFFKNSLIFENNFAPASWTMPVAATLYSSLFPYQHNVMDRYDGSSLSGDVDTIPEIFKNNGYKTAAFTGGGDYDRKYNVAQGFDTYLDKESYMEYGIEAEDETSPLTYIGTAPLIPVAERWLTENKGEKFFTLLQGFDTHCPFTPKEPFDTKFDSDYSGNIDYSTCLWTFNRIEPTFEDGIKSWAVRSLHDGKAARILLSDRDIEHMVSLYDGEIAQADNNFKNFFEKIAELDLEKNTIFVFMSEHGDLFGEHGRFMRGGPLRGTFYDPVLNAPLLIKHPKIDEPIKVESLFQSVDFLPTLIEIFGFDDKQKDLRQGQSIVPTLIGEEEINDYVYAASEYTARNDNVFFNGRSVVETIRNKEWKLIKEEIYEKDTKEKTIESYELFNISKDPKEENNLINQEIDIAEDLKDKLEKWSKNFEDSKNEGKDNVLSSKAVDWIKGLFQ